MMNLREIAKRIALHHEVRLFVPHMERYYPRGRVTESPGFQVELIPCRLREFNPYHLTRAVRQRVDSFRPDLVWITDGWTLKPYVIKCLADYRPWHSFFAYEMLCPVNGARFSHGRLCRNTVLNNPFRCNLEVVRELGLSAKRRALSCISHESLVALAFSPTYRRLAHDALASCRRHIVYGNHYFDILNSLSDKLTVIPGGVDTNRFVPGPGAGDGILMAGRVDDPAKGLRVISDAVRRLRQKGLNVDLKVTGSGNYGDGTRSLGWVPTVQMPQVYQNAAVVVIPSLWEEPFGLVAVEAMACGLPVVASRQGGLESIVVEAETGFLVKPGDDAALADRLEELLTDVNLRQRMGSEARRRAVEFFDWDKIVNSYYLPLIQADTKGSG